MALLGRQSHVAVGEDHIVGVERQVLIDPKSGVAAEVENVTVAVDMGDGNIAVARQQRVRGYQAGYGSAQPRAVQYQQPRQAVTYRDPNEDVKVNHLVHCIICLFCPCWIFVWLLLCCAYGC